MVMTYFSEEELINHLRCEFPRSKQYSINFKRYLSTLKPLNNGNFSLIIENRKFIIDKYTGFVLDVFEV